MKNPADELARLEVIKHHLFTWITSLVVVIGVSAAAGSFELEAQQLAHEAEQERIEEMRIEKEEKAQIEKEKIALYKKAQDMTGFGQMVASK